MAELSSREVVRTARLCGEKPANAEKNQHRKPREMKDKVAPDGPACESARPVAYLGDEGLVFADNAPGADENTAVAAADDEAAADVVILLEDEGVGSSEDGSEGEPKKRCCDRYDSSESSDSGVVVLSSTDCSSCSSSGCSGHSDITEPDSPYSSPGPCAASPEEFLPGSGEESEDAPSPTTLDPRPPDPDEDWPFDEDSDPGEASKCQRKRPYPWKGVIASSTPKRMRMEEGEEAKEAGNNNLCCTTNSNNTSSTTSPAQYQQPPAATGRKSRSDRQQHQQKQWPLAGKLDAKGQIKITEYFKTQVKAKNGFKKELEIKLFPAQVKELLMENSAKQLPSLKTIIKSSIEEEEEWSKNTACYIKSRTTTTFIKDERPKDQEAVKQEQPNRLDECIPESRDEETATVVEEVARNMVLDLANAMCFTETTSTINVITNGGSLELENKTESVTAAPLSPILSQPKVIRFPVPSRNLPLDKCQMEVETIRCSWKDCQVEFVCGSKLIDHLHSQHVNTQTNGESFVCMWVGCKVYDKTSCSRSWLERHVSTHGGNKPFKCIVDGCGQRFSTQTILQRHVNSHFTTNGVTNGSAGNGTRKSLESASNKLFKRNGKRLRLRRQPWSARMFDYMDAGKMEGVTYRLMTFSQQQMANVSNEEQQKELESGRNLALRCEIVAQRTELDGTRKVLVHWHPENILPDEWLKESEYTPTKIVPLSSLSPAGTCNLHHSLLPANNKVSRRPRKTQPRNRSNKLCS